MEIIKILHIPIAILLMIVILLQNRGTGLSGVFGGSDNVFRTKRGVEKSLFTATVVLSILFLAISIAGIML